MGCIFEGGAYFIVTLILTSKYSTELETSSTFLASLLFLSFFTIFSHNVYLFDYLVGVMLDRMVQTLIILTLALSHHHYYIWKNFIWLMGKDEIFFLLLAFTFITVTKSSDKSFLYVSWTCIILCLTSYTFLRFLVIAERILSCIVTYSWFAFFFLQCSWLWNELWMEFISVYCQRLSSSG